MADRKRELSLQIEAEGRTFDFNDQVLVIESKEEPIIKLHFLSFGILADNPKESHLEAKVKNLSKVSVKDEEYCVTLQEVIISDPELENFSTIRTGINPGYVYIIDENKPDEPVEFEVDAYGNFKSVSWEKGGDGFPDVRTTDGKNNTNGYYEAEFCAVVWAAYSPIQWTKEYYDSLVGDTTKRKNRMTQIQASGFPLETSEYNASDHGPYTAITTYFSSENKSGCSSVQKKIDNVQKQEEKRAKNRKENPDHQEPEVLTDMFVTLDDPINSAIEITEVLSDKILYFKALVDAIQTGEEIEDAYDRICEGCLEGPEPEKEYQSLISLALTCYLMIYNDKESILKYDGGTPGWHLNDRHGLDPRPENKTFYGKHTSHTLPNTSRIGYGLDYEKLKGILGIKERETQRDHIQSLKKDMATFIKIKDLKKILEDYLHNLPERTLEGRGLALDLLDGLMINTYDFDRHMLLKKDYKPTDKWIDWGYEILNNEFEEQYTNTEVTSTAPGYENFDPLYALLTPLINIEKVVDKSRSISHKIAKVYKKKLGHHAKQAFVVKKVGRTMFKEIAEKQEFVVKKLNQNLTVYGEQMFEIQDGEMRMKLHKMGVEIDTDYIQQSKHVRLKGKYNFAGTKTGNLLKRRPGFKNTKRELEILRALVGEENIDILETIDSGDKQNKIALRVREMVTNAEIEANKPNVKIAQMINGRAFNGVFAGLEAINLIAAFNKVKSENSWKNRINFVGAGVKITEAGTNLYKAQLSFKNPKNLKLPGIGKLASQLSLVGGAFTAGMCFWESVEAMDKGDLDSGIALAFAGAAFGISTATSLSIFAASSVAGPLGWIAAGIGVGLLIIAALLTDSEVETFFKNFLLSDTEKFTKEDDESPMEYSLRILENKYDLTDDDYRTSLMNPADAEAALMDAIVCKTMEFIPTTLNIEEKDTIYYGMDQFTVTEETIRGFKVTMSYLHFFNDPDQVGYRVFLYPDGIEKGNGEELTPDRNVQRVKDKKGKEAVQIQFNIDDHLLNSLTRKSEVLFTTRLAIDTSTYLYFPYPVQGEERWLGALVKAQRKGVFLTSFIQSKDVVSATLEDLLNPETW